MLAKKIGKRLIQINNMYAAIFAVVYFKIQFNLHELHS